MHHRLHFILCLALALLLAGCSTAKRLENINRRTGELLGEAQGLALGEGIEVEKIEIEGYTPWTPENDGDAAQLSLNLRTALELAAKHSRNYQTSKEALFSSALALISAQHDWDWNPVHNLSALLGISQSPNSQTTFSSDSSIGFTKRLLTGGRLSGSLALTTLQYLSGNHALSMQSIARLTLTQPLLGGSGMLVAREPLTQAERNLIYALRTYIRAREQLLINIAELYYAVLNAEANLTVGEMSYASLKYSRDRSQAMGEGGRVTQIDVDQAQQRLLSAESNLVTYHEAIQNAKDKLKIALAIPLTAAIDVDPNDMAVLLKMTLPRPSMTLEEAIELALQQRLDFATTKDRLEDAERAVAIARDNMRTKLDLTASASAESESRNRLAMPRFGDASYSVGLSADLPFDRTNETVALRRQLINLEQQRREIDQQREDITLSLRTTWNNLRSFEQKVQIQKISVSLAEKRVENTRMLFEDGRIAIREYLDAQDDLSNARNSLTQQLVTHRMCWLRLLYQLDELKVDPQTLWTNRLEMI